MCVSCGCGAPEDKHGDSRNITLSELTAAAAAAHISAAQLADNIHGGLIHHSLETDKLAQDIEDMNEPLPNGLFRGQLESTPYPE